MFQISSSHGISHLLPPNLHQPQVHECCHLAAQGPKLRSPSLTTFSPLLCSKIHDYYSSWEIMQSQFSHFGAQLSKLGGIKTFKLKETRVLGSLSTEISCTCRIPCEHRALIRPPSFCPARLLPPAFPHRQSSKNTTYTAARGGDCYSYLIFLVFELGQFLRTLGLLMFRHQRAC